MSDIADSPPSVHRSSDDKSRPGSHIRSLRCLPHLEEVMKAKSRVHAWVLSLMAATAFMPSAATAADAAPYVYVSGEDLLSLRGAAPNADAETRINGGKLRFFCSARPLSSIDMKLDALERCDSIRRISERAHQIEVARIAVGRGGCSSTVGREVEVRFAEAKRGTLFGENLKALLKFALDKAVGGAAPASVVVPSFSWCLLPPQKHVLQLDRAQLTITAQYAAAKNDEEAKVKVDEGVATAQMITGPKEHIFLSGDAVVRGANQVKWDAATRTLVAQDKPDQLYLGVNFMRGDIYARHDAWTTDRLVVKFLFQPSKKPFDSVGLALGYRFADGVFTLNDDADSGGFVVFAGAFWTRTDQLDAAGAVVGGKRERSWRVGVSYSLGTLLDWLK
jgi:hypothetical protein